MGAAVTTPRRGRLRVLGFIAGALFGVAGVLVPVGVIFVISALSGLAPATPSNWMGLLVAVAPLIVGAALSVVWLRRAGFPRAGLVTIAAGAIAIVAGWLSMLALTPVLALLYGIGIEMPDTAAMSLLPWLAALLGAIAGFFVWRPLARGLGRAAAQPPAANPASAI